LAKHDAKLFASSKDGLHDVARVFADKSSLEEDSDLGEVIKNANHEFGIFADHGLSVFERYRSELLAAIERGVKVRIVLLDPKTLDSGQCDELLGAMKRDKQLLAKKLETCRTMLKDWQQQVSKGKGSLEVRYLPHPVFHKMWIRDRTDADNAMVHVTVLQYRGRLTPPSFRSTNMSSTNAVSVLVDEFEEIWNRAQTIP
jgi:hypothetical protein